MDKFLAESGYPLRPSSLGLTFHDPLYWINFVTCKYIILGLYQSLPAYSYFITYRCRGGHQNITKKMQCIVGYVSLSSEPPTVLILRSVLVLILEKEYTKVLKFRLQNEHNWGIIGKLLTEILKCHEKYWNSENVLSPWSWSHALS